MNKGIILRRAYPSEAEIIADLMTEVHERLTDKSLFVCDNLDFIREHIQNSGMAVAAFSEDRMIGCMLVRFPGGEEDNLGLDVGLTDELDRVAHMESSAVLPEYRGRGLQYRMIMFAESLIDKDRYDVFMSTVSPYNAASCRSFEKAGYSAVLTKEKYGGYLRRIYMKRLQKNLP